MPSALQSVWIRGAITVAILAYLGSRIDMPATGLALLSVDLRYLLLVLLLIAVDRAGMILRWILLLKSSGHSVSAKSAAWIHMVSTFLGSVLPAGVGGDVARAYTLSQRTARGSEAVASVAVDRLVGVTSLAVMGVVGLIVWMLRRGEAPQTLSLVAILFIMAIGSLVVWSDRVVRRVLPSSWHASGLVSRLLELSDAVAGYRRRPAALGVVFLVSLGVQTLRIVEAYLLGRGLGIQVAFSSYLVFMPVGLLAFMLPISVAGFGLPQGVIVWLLRPLGVSDPLSFALSTLFVLTGLVGHLPGALLYARSRKG